MPDCPSCRKPLERRHRTLVEKLLYRDAFRCAACAREVRRLGALGSVRASFYLSRYTRCIRCSSHRVRRQKHRDRIDFMSRRVISLVLRLTGAPLNRCPACRLQYYDWRPIKVQAPTPVEAPVQVPQADTAA